MPGSRGRKLNRRVVHKSTGGTLLAIPLPVDPVGNPPPPTFNTVAHRQPRCGRPPLLSK
jgi:hypothetical protein